MAKGETEAIKPETTKKGELSVISGFEDNIKEYEPIEGTVDEKVFNSICNLELERNKINKNESSYAFLSLQNSFELLNEISSDEKQLIVLQCIQFIKKEIRVIDTIYVENISNIHILISEINPNNCQPIFHKIQLLLNLFLDEKYPKIKPYYKATLSHLKTHIEIKNQLKNGLSQQNIALKYNVSRSCILNIHLNKTWKWVI